MIIKRKLFLEHSYITGFKDSLFNLLWRRVGKNSTKQMQKVLPSQFELFHHDYPAASEGFPCTSCGLCEDVCPTKALELVISNQIDMSSHLTSGPSPKHLYLEESKCIKCGLCVEICPTDALVLQSARSPLTANLAKVDLKQKTS